MHEESKSEEKDKIEQRAPKQITFPSYPSHGIIGSGNPPWLNGLKIASEDSNQKEHADFRKQKFDFHQMYESGLNKPSSHNKQNPPPPPTPLPGLWSLWQRLNNISPEFYETQTTLNGKGNEDIPARFKQPGLLQGYGCEKEEHPFFQTTSSTYGKFPPTIHDVPRQYHSIKTGFSSHLASTGMPKNRSLNIK